MVFPKETKQNRRTDGRTETTSATRRSQPRGEPQQRLSEAVVTAPGRPTACSPRLRGPGLSPPAAKRRPQYGPRPSGRLAGPRHPHQTSPTLGAPSSGDRAHAAGQPAITHRCVHTWGKVRQNQTQSEASTENAGRGGHGGFKYRGLSPGPFALVPAASWPHPSGRVPGRPHPSGRVPGWPRPSGEGPKPAPSPARPRPLCPAKGSSRIATRQALGCPRGPGGSGSPRFWN